MEQNYTSTPVIHEDLDLIESPKSISSLYDDDDDWDDEEDDDDDDD